MLGINRCPECNAPANDLAFPASSTSYLKDRNGHVWAEEDSMTSLSDCAWWDEAVARRPFWAKGDCGGRILDSAHGTICENHYNALPVAVG